MGHLEPWAVLFMYLSFIVWVPLFAISMYLFSFAALMAEQNWSWLNRRWSWLVVVFVSGLTGLLGFSLAGSITQETLAAYPYAVVVGTALVILQKRLISRHIRRAVANVVRESEPKYDEARN